MREQFSDVAVNPGVAEAEVKPYADLRGRELVQWALLAGKECIGSFGSTQEKYFQAVARRAGVGWPEGFFESTIEQLWRDR